MSADAAVLAIRIQGGDHAAESEMVSRYGPGVATILRRATREPALADDLYQEAFRIAIQRIRQGELRQPEKLPGFVCQLARNLAAGHFRQSRRRAKQDGIDDAGPADPGPNALARLLHDEKAALVRRVLDELPTERDRQLLFGFYIAEEDKSALCSRLGLSALHFNRVLHRARERYRELFEQRLRGRELQAGALGSPAPP